MSITLEDSFEITKKHVEDFEVFNIELQSNTQSIKEDDLLYVDYESCLINHNCLRKDWGQINENFPQTDIILQAYKINEFVPKMYIDTLSEKIDLTNKTVGVLGYTAKRDVDDTRDALTPKLLRYLQKKLPEKILINDPNLPLGNFKDTYTGYEFNNISMQDVIANSEVVIIAMNHSEYEKLTAGDFDGKVLLDGWNIVKQKLLNDFRK